MEDKLVGCRFETFRESFAGGHRRTSRRIGQTRLRHISTGQSVFHPDRRPNTVTIPHIPSDMEPCLLEESWRLPGEGRLWSRTVERESVAEDLSMCFGTRNSYFDTR